MSKITTFYSEKITESRRKLNTLKVVQVIHKVLRATKIHYNRNSSKLLKNLINEMIKIFT